MDNRPALKARMAKLLFGAEVYFFVWMIIGWPLWNLISFWMQ
tara:strand:- start:2897 stop:3022 length:126 start_codon:yes stop_codon:yes gene_type:complete